MTPLQRLEAAMFKAVTEYMDAFREGETEELERMITGLEDSVGGVHDYMTDLKDWVAARS